MKKIRFEELEVGKCYTQDERDLIFVKMRNDYIATFHLVDYDEETGAGFETDEEIELTQSECYFRVY